MLKSQLKKEAVRNTSNRREVGHITVETTGYPKTTLQSGLKRTRKNKILFLLRIRKNKVRVKQVYYFYMQKDEQFCILIFLFQLV